MEEFIKKNTGFQYADAALKNGLVGPLEDVVVYCNEKEWDGKGFLLKCCEGCEHNPIKK